MTTHQDGSMTLTVEEWACIAALAHDAYSRDDTIGGLLTIGAFRLFGDDESNWGKKIVMLSRAIDAGNQEFVKLRQAKVDEAKARIKTRFIHDGGQ